MENDLQARIKELESQNRALVEALENIKQRIGGNDELPGVESFYRGYNSSLRACQAIGNKALHQLPADTLKRYKAEHEVIRTAINFVHCQGDGLNDLRKAVEVLEGLA